MKDYFGNNKPVQIELNEWWFNGRIIVKQDDFRLPSWISFPDTVDSSNTIVHLNKSEAIKYSFENPFFQPSNLPKDYIGTGNSKLIEYINNSEGIYIFSPYIKLETLEELIDVSENVKAVFVRWETKDLILGSSDLEIYPYLKAKGITFFRNPRLHLKAYLDEYKNCFLTSANISSRALNLPPYSNYNYEIGTVVQDLGIDDRLYFNIIESDSILITDNIFMQLSDQLIEKKKEFPDEEEFQFTFEAPDKDFLISALPMTYSVETLYRIYEDQEFISETELNCALHDLAIYKIPLGLNSHEFRQRLSEAFFSHSFIKSFLENIATTGEIYFGTAKEWIHKNCTDVPTPRKWEITGNIQILYRWIVKLGNGQFEVDVPGTHSQRLRMIKQG